MFSLAPAPFTMVVLSLLMVMVSAGLKPERPRSRSLQQEKYRREEHTPQLEKGPAC